MFLKGNLTNKIPCIIMEIQAGSGPEESFGLEPGGEWLAD